MASNNQSYKSVGNVARRTWDLEAYERKAKARQEAVDGDGSTATRKLAPAIGSAAAGTNVAGQHDTDVTKEEFRPAEAGAIGPEGSKRSFLKARREKVDIDSKVGTTECVSAEAAATTSTKIDADDPTSLKASNGVTKTGVGWHCKVCDCFLKDSHTYLDHINGRKHQRNLGYSMRVERSTKDELMNRLGQLTKKKKEDELQAAVINPLVATNYEDIVKSKDEEAQRRKQERQRKRQERKKKLQEPVEEEETEEEGINPDMAALMGFSGFGGGNKN